MEQNRQGAKAAYVLLTITAVLWVLLPSAVRRFNREAFTEFQAPALHLVGKGRDLARYWELKSRNSEELVAASRDLARVNAALELKLAMTQDLRDENKRLREIAHYTPPNTFYTVVARVGLREATSWWHRINVRKGLDDGVRPGCPVIFGNRVVGRVVLVHKNSAEVDLITSPAFRCTAFLEGDDQNRMVVVDGRAANSLTPPAARVWNIPYDYSIPAGIVPKVMTTGLGGIYPSHLILGTLDSSVRNAQDGNFKEGILRPTHELFSLQEVTILVPTKPSRAEDLLSGRYEEFQ